MHYVTHLAFGGTNGSILFKRVKPLIRVLN